ncbi:LINE-1 retrotransposable element ORF1 protein [Nibea albiflora]|nr:LINE-1 retrotransposable element ORF1 protein [Nibea albiflora]
MTSTLDPPQADTAAELTSIKTLLQGIASNMSDLKSGMDAVKAAVENLGARVTEAETRISALEDHDQSMSVAVDAASKTIAQLQEKITYLEDAGRRNNVRIVGVAEGAEGGDMQRFARTFLEETLDIEMGPDFEIERAHRTGQRGNRDRHVLVRFLKFGAREAVLKAAREKERVEWRGKRVSFFQDLSQDIIQRRKKFDGVKKQLQEKGLRYTMIYPAVLRVVADNIRHAFTSPEEVRSFISKRA